MYKWIPSLEFLDTNVFVIAFHLGIFGAFWCAQTPIFWLWHIVRFPFILLMFQLVLVVSNQTEWEATKREHITYLKVPTCPTFPSIKTVTLFTFIGYSRIQHGAIWSRLFEKLGAVLFRTAFQARAVEQTTSSKTTMDVLFMLFQQWWLLVFLLAKRLMMNMTVLVFSS